MSNVLVNMPCGQSRQPFQIIGWAALFIGLIACLPLQAQFVLSPDFANEGSKTIYIDDFHEPIDIINAGGDSLIILTNAGYVDSLFDYDVALMKFSPSGEVDPFFGNDGLLRFDFPGIEYSIADEMLQLDDGNLLVLGSGYGFDSTSYWPACLTLINKNGTIDSSFGIDGTLPLQFAGLQEYPNSLEIDSENRILVGGSSLDTGHTHSDVPVIARLNLDGTYDNTFGEGGKTYLRFPNGVIHETRNERHLLGGIIYDLLELDNGKLLVCGGHSNAVNLIVFVACLNPDGSLDEAFFDEGYLAIDISTYDNSEAIKLVKGNDNTIWFGANVQALELKDFIIGKIDLNHQTFDIGAIDFNDNEDFMMDMIMGNNNLPLMIGRSKYPENTAPHYLSNFFAVSSLTSSSFPYNSQNFAHEYNPGWQSGAAAGVLQSNGRLICLGFSQTQSNGANELVIMGLDDQSLGIENPWVSHLNTYPNPTTGPVNINLDASHNYQIEVYNEMGQLVLSQSTKNGHKFNFSMENFPSGIYSISLTDDGGNIRFDKVMVSHPIH